MKKLFIIVMACYALNARSQENESKNFLYLYSDSTVYAQRVRLRPDFSNNWALRVDSRKVPIEQVKFFSNEDGFFANTRKLSFSGQASFSERIVAGKINLYQQVIYNSIPYEADYHRFRSARSQVIDTRMYYNKGFSDLKKVNYKNLSLDMADNRQSLDLLEGYRRSMRSGSIMYVGAGLAFIASAVTLLSGSGIKQSGTGYGNMPNYKSTNSTGSFLLLGLGAGLGLGGYLMQTSGSRNIERAIDTYNY